jgi:PIN domain nuclease of toxin-antitoxin system
MAHLKSEPGADVVAEALTGRPAISVVIWAEVLGKLAERGEDPAVAAAEMKAEGLIGGVIAIEPVREEDCITIARLRVRTRKRGISQSDRTCLALAERLKVPALTSDRKWTEVDVEAKVRLFR